MIRHADRSDIPRLLEMGKRFADDAGVTDLVEWDDDSVTAMLEYLIDDPKGILLVGEKSMFGGFVYPHEFNRKVLVFKECFWRSEGHDGVRMLKIAEQLATDMGASIAGMFTPIKMNPDAVGRLYERLGYTPGERAYSKRL